jgi:hypothetical protein
VLNTTFCHAPIVVDQWNDLSVASSPQGEVFEIYYNAGGWDAATGNSPAPPVNKDLRPIVASSRGVTLGTPLHRLLKLDPSAGSGNPSNFGFASKQLLDSDNWLFELNRGVVSQMFWTDTNC